MKTLIIFFLFLSVVLPVDAQWDMGTSKEFEEFYLGNAERLDVDRHTSFYDGYAVLRKNGQYAVIDQYGGFVIPYGKYLIDIDDEEYFRSQGFYNVFAIRVRSPETGLFGLFALSMEEEIIPCEYNELTPFYNYSEVAFAVQKDLKTNKRSEFFIHMDGTKIPYDSERIYFNPKEPSRYAPFRNNYTDVRYYDILLDTTITLFKEYKSGVSYYGNDLFKVEESFNGLRKFGFVNRDGEMVIPFQLSDGISRVYGFQAAHDPAKPQLGFKYIAPVEAFDNHYFKFLLMDGQGNTISKLSKDDAGYSDLRLYDYALYAKEKGEIMGGKILLQGEKAGLRNPILWHVNEPERLVSLYDMIMENIPPMTSFLRTPTFSYKGRNGKVIVFSSEAEYKISVENVKKLFPMAQVLQGGQGIGGSNKPHGYRVLGIGIMNESTGNIDVQPMFTKLEIPDYTSGLAYAELWYNGMLYKGFIDTDVPEGMSFRGNFKFIVDVVPTSINEIRIN